MTMAKGGEHRTAGHDVEQIIIDRWSPRAMSGDALDEAAIGSLFEAAKWAPSSFNGQPWRFVYARRDTPHWQSLFDLLMDVNKTWAKDAALLIVVLSRKTFEHNDKPALTHSFDTGAACENLLLQASAMGLAGHAMQGFDYERARTELGIPEDYAVEAMIAVGHPGEKSSLPDGLRQRETPSPRKTVTEIAMEGRFGQ